MRVTAILRWHCDGAVPALVEMSDVRTFVPLA